jgi:hypothetical protein
LKVTCRVIYELRKINFVDVQLSTFVPIKRIVYISFTDAKERNENIRFEKITG